MDDENNKGTGILGLGGAPVPKSPDDPSASDDAEAVQRRRDRVRAEAEEEAAREPKGDHTGAAGVDMGSGGEGTDVSGS